jgi:hypothetical protein
MSQTTLKMYCASSFKALVTTNLYVDISQKTSVDCPEASSKTSVTILQYTWLHAEVKAARGELLFKRYAHECCAGTQRKSRCVVRLWQPHLDVYVTAL